MLKITPRTFSTEAHALQYLRSTGLDIPIPRLIASFVESGTTYTIMTRLPGITVMNAMNNNQLSPEMQKSILGEISAIIEKLQTLRQPAEIAGKVMMSASGDGLPDPISWFEEWSGPFASTLELWSHVSSHWDMEEFEEDVPTETRHIMTMDPIRFVHSDLRTYNVLLHNGHISGIVDWQDSGWFPSSWQVHTMRWARVGCDRFWLLYWRDVHRFSPEAEAAYAASKTFLIQSPV